MDLKSVSDIPITGTDGLEQAASKRNTGRNRIMAKLYSNLSEIAKGSEQAVKNALLQTAADIVNVAKQLSPVDTGALKQSIGAIPETSTSILIGTDKEYAVFVEYGTSRSPAQPFLTPAFSQAVPTFEKRLSQEMQKLANK